MPRIDTYEAKVIVNGTPLPEFQTTEKNLVATCYIPSEVGQSFTVRLTDIVPSRHDPVYLQLYFDGHLVGERALYNRTEVDFDGKKISDTRVRSFVFASREETAGDQSGIGNDSDKLGEIRLEISFARITEMECTCSCMSEFEKKNDRTVVDMKVERAVKPVPHCIRYGDEVIKKRSSTPSNSGCSARHRTYQPHRVGYCIRNFIFKYRPIDVLQANNIAPRPSQPGLNSPSSQSPVPSTCQMEVYSAEDSDELISEGEEEESDFSHV